MRPSDTLITVKDIKEAIQAGTYGRSAFYVRAETTGPTGTHQVNRVIDARTRRGILEVKDLYDGKWYPATRVWMN